MVFNLENHFWRAEANQQEYTVYICMHQILHIFITSCSVNKIMIVSVALYKISSVLQFKLILASVEFRPRSDLETVSAYNCETAS